MSWNAHLSCQACGSEVGWWNFTHNTSKMIYASLSEGGYELSEGESWWMHLNDMAGPAGAVFLNRILRGLEADPDRFRAMNPGNGWGSYDDLVKLLTEMRDRVPESPTSWGASG